VNYIYWLSQIQHSEQSLVGNHVYVLSQLLQHDNAILPGFVLGNNLLRQFLTNSDDFQSLIEELSDSSFSLDVNDSLGLQSLASRSRSIINRVVFPQALETEIFQAAQQLNSNGLILQPFISSPSGQNLGSKGFWRSHTCNAHPQAITQTIKQVWAELFSANSLVYRHKLGLSGKAVNVEILVRPLKDAYASGIIEVTKDLMRIKAVWGQKQSLLQGDVEPDEYYLDRHTGYLLFCKLGLKNYGYRVKNIDLKVPLLDCLEAYIPSETIVKTYVLNQNISNLLLQSSHNILQKQPQIKYLEWTALAKESIDSFDFFFTQFENSLTSSINLSEQQTTLVLASTTIKPLLIGTSAVPGKAVAKVVIIKDGTTQPESIPADSILVIKNLIPRLIPLVKQVKGIITEIGGKTSHGAIIARELNIPAIVNATDATTLLSDGIEVFLNGDEGKVYPAATATRQPPLSNLSTDRLLTRQKSIATKLMVNISQPESIPLSLNLPVDGVGLLRAELMLGGLLAGKSLAKWQSESGQKVFIQELTESLGLFVKAFAPRPVFYRSLDWTNKETANPIVGNRGTYSYQSDSTLFSLELKALKAIANAGYSNLNLILPFVRSVEEFKFCHRQLEKIGLTDRESFQVWIMAEVPSVIWLLPEYIKAGVQGIAIGTNDLTQLLLGVDREQVNFSKQGLNANHTAVQKAIAQLIAIARENQIDCCICGQAPVEYPDLIDKLVSWGITAISVEPEAVNRTYKAIALAEQRILLDASKLN